MATAKGCSKDSAQRIVDLLFQESGGDALLQINQTFKNSNIKPAEKPKPRPVKKPKAPPKRGGCSKMTPELIHFVNKPENRQLHVKDLQKKIKAELGISLSTQSMYKALRLNPAKYPLPKQESD